MRLNQRSWDIQSPLPRGSDVSALARVQRNLDACIRCGLCLESCPTYQLTNLEEESPRGRVVLAQAVLDGYLEPSADFADHELSCLVCEACTAVCPAGVRMEEIQVGVRQTLRMAGRISWLRRLLARSLRTLGDRRRLERRVRTLAFIKRMRLDRFAAGLGILRGLGLSRASLPTPPREFLPPQGGRWLPPEEKQPRGSIVLFAGCLMSTLLAEFDVATGELLAAAGYEVDVVAGQTCCGALSAHQGDLPAATAMAQRNLEALGADDRPIVLNSAGCGAFLREYPVHFGLEYASIAQRVVDLSELLADDGRLQITGSPPGGPVAFQDPCHLRLAQGIVSAPRRLLSRIPGIHLVDLDNPEVCCGSAGVYNITNRATARELGRRKVEDILRAGARTVVTANPGCFLHLRGMLQVANSDVEVRYLPELVRASCPTTVQWEPADVPMAHGRGED